MTTLISKEQSGSPKSLMNQYIYIYIDIYIYTDIYIFFKCIYIYIISGGTLVELAPGSTPRLCEGSAPPRKRKVDGRSSSGRVYLQHGGPRQTTPTNAENWDG